MTEQTIVALFHTREQAETARLQLEGAGIPATDIRLSEGPVEAAAATRGDAARHGGFWEWLFGASPSAEDLERYRAHAARGGAALSVRVEGNDADRITELLEQHDLVAIEGAAEDENEAGVLSPRAATTAAGERESTLPTAREELDIAKRRVSEAKTYRIRRYVVERPTEQQVSLHDERVEIERRPAQSTAGGTEPFQEKIVEVTETREEPVVTKRVVPGEEVVVRKSGQDRVETVRDTVRESRVEVDRAAAGNKPSTRKEELPREEKPSPVDMPPTRPVR